ncbi:hypothetical protein [Streptomyces sp. S1]|uniref:hypothetical protein n=1 Tax=Streptomyces sp. S1 TaxID=718288 RepID=UPI003D723B4E
MLSARPPPARPGRTNRNELPQAALALCASRKESPGVGGAFALVVLLGFGLLFWLNHA